MAIEVGNIFEGRVTGVKPFGAFVALPEGRVGMVHISEVSNEFVQDIAAVLHDGDTVKVQVINVAPDGKIALSIKRLLPQEPRAPRAPREDRGPRPYGNGPREGGHGGNRGGRFGGGQGGVAEQFRVIAERQGVHFLDAEGCEFNRIDFMHLTRHGHAQLAEKLAELVPTLL